MDERILKYFQEELSHEERLRLLREAEADEELMRQFAEYQNGRALLNLGAQTKDLPSGRQEFDRFITQRRRASLRKQWLTGVRRVAAIVLLVVSSSLLTYYFVHPEGVEGLPENEMNTLYTPAGQRAQLTLQDGTEVWLNAKSKLTYPARFTGDKREVTVEGEAFFKVAKDLDRPFIVSADAVEMKVLGTQFNVSCYPATGYVQTSLLEGSVRVFFRDREEEGVTLKPDQQVTVRNGKMKVEPIGMKDHFLWRDGIYAFENEPLMSILEKLELYYDIQIVVEDRALFKDTYTGKFRQRDSLDDIFHVLQQIRPFKVEKNTERSVITLRK